MYLGLRIAIREGKEKNIEIFPGDPSLSFPRKFKSAIDPANVKRLKGALKSERMWCIFCKH
jgi:hypothetical protein